MARQEYLRWIKVEMLGQFLEAFGLVLDIDYDIRSLLSKTSFSPQSHGGHGAEILLFGGERPPNKRHLLHAKYDLSFCRRSFGNSDSVPLGTEFMIQSTSCDWIIRNFPSVSSVPPW
jgi:hypothetical protein